MITPAILSRDLPLNPVDLRQLQALISEALYQVNKGVIFVVVFLDTEIEHLTQ